MKLNTSGEDYLKAIYILQTKKGNVRSTDVASFMGVSRPSVSNATKLLRKGGFLVMKDDYTLHLTDSGRKVAEKLYERHQYFTERLMDAGVDAGIAEAEACKMEHAISNDSFHKIKTKERKKHSFTDNRNKKPVKEK